MWRNFKAHPNAFQEKDVLRFIQENYKNPTMYLAVYLVLTQIASDIQSDDLETYGVKIMEMSGVWRDSLRQILNSLHADNIISLESGILLDTKEKVFWKMKIGLLELQPWNQGKVKGKVKGGNSSPIDTVKDTVKDIIKENSIKENSEQSLEEYIKSLEDGSCYRGRIKENPEMKISEYMKLWENDTVSYCLLSWFYKLGYVPRDDETIGDFREWIKAISENNGLSPVDMKSIADEWWLYWFWVLKDDKWKKIKNYRQTFANTPSLPNNKKRYAKR